MADATDIPAWIALFLGLYALAAAIGEFRAPGLWLKMVNETASGAGLQFLGGIFCITLGASIYLVNPWNPGDWLAVVITVMGGLVVLEGMALLAFGGPFMTFAKIFMGIASRGWAAFAGVLGIALVVVALLRL